MYITANLKRLRKQQNRTQEELASTLGVTAQAVSNWERGETFPDIFLLPKLAREFKVSIDALMGMDEVSANELRGSIFTIKSAERNDTDKIAILEKQASNIREALLQLPDDLSLLQHLSDLLIILSISTEEPKKKLYAGEGIALRKKCVELTANGDDRFALYLHRNQINSLMHAYLLLGDRESAREIAEKMPMIQDSSELALLQVLEGEELLRHWQTTIQQFFDRIYTEIELYVLRENYKGLGGRYNFKETETFYTPQEHLLLLQKAVAVLDIYTTPMKFSSTRTNTPLRTIKWRTLSFNSATLTTL